jgi:hypothetical protein
MLEDRELADDEWYLAARQLFDKKVAMRMLTVEDCEILPAPPGLVEAFQFVGDPGGLRFGRLQLDDAVLSAFELVRLK